MVIMKLSPFLAGVSLDVHLAYRTWLALADIASYIVVFRAV